MTSLPEEQKPSPLLLLDSFFSSWHSVLPGHDGVEILVKFIEANQQHTCFSHRMVPQTLLAALASRSVLRCKFLKQVSFDYLFDCTDCHTA